MPAEEALPVGPAFQARIDHGGRVPFYARTITVNRAGALLASSRNETVPAQDKQSEKARTQTLPRALQLLREKKTCLRCCMDERKKKKKSSKNQGNLHKPSRMTGAGKTKLPVHLPALVSKGSRIQCILSNLTTKYYTRFLL